jgi:hypothetical protein
MGSAPPVGVERVETLDAFLGRHGAGVIDVLPGADPSTRRLLVAPRTGTRPTHAVAVSTKGTEDPLLVEERVLRGAALLHLELSRTLPRVVGRVQLAPQRSGIVLSAVPGLGRTVSTGAASLPGQLLAAVSDWLGLLWRETASGDAAPTLGAHALSDFLARYGGWTRLRLAPLQLQAARDRLAAFPVPRALVHGCLCPRHVRFGATRVVGVDDWSLASTEGNPLLDLGGFAARLAGHRLPEVVAGTTSAAGLYRQFLAVGLSRLGLPRSLWRDVLLLSQFQIAARALDRGEPEQMTLLVALLAGLAPTGQGTGVRSG